MPLEYVMKDNTNKPVIFYDKNIQMLISSRVPLALDDDMIKWRSEVDIMLNNILLSYSSNKQLIDQIINIGNFDNIQDSEDEEMMISYLFPCSTVDIKAS